MKERIICENFRTLYAQTDPQEAARRCRMVYDSEKNRFEIKVFGAASYLSYPQGILTDADGNEETDYALLTLIFRHLCEFCYKEPQGRLLSYREIPWGEVFFPNFSVTCIKNLADFFGSDLSSFHLAMSRIPSEKADMGDAAYRFSFIEDYAITFILWESDEEFPPSAQILFDDNFPSAFSAEDIAVIGETAVSKIKGLLQKY